MLPAGHHVLWAHHQAPLGDGVEVGQQQRIHRHAGLGCLLANGISCFLSGREVELGHTSETRADVE